MYIGKQKYLGIYLYICYIKTYQYKVRHLV